MARNFDTRLTKLRNRRQGPQDAFKEAAHDSFLKPLEESYQKRGVKTASTYALGAMQQVDPDYTAKSFEEGNRVKNQLEKSLDGHIPVEFDYQGSVPLNVHIKGVSDVDLLLIRTVYLVIDRYGPRANSHYSDWTGPSGLTLLSQLRIRAEQILINAFPEALVKTGGSKAISLSGGSLRRKIDVIPSHRYDSSDYQRSLLKKDRGIFIYLKNENELKLNYPFLHMHKIQEKDEVTIGNTKKIIRLLKTLAADYEDGSPIELSSYDIASLVWHFESSELLVQNWNELALLWVAKASLDNLIANETHTKGLITPDGTRKIIDKAAKFSGLVALRNELDDLVREVAAELNGIQIYSEGEIRRVLKDSFVSPVM